MELYHNCPSCEADLIIEIEPWTIGVIVCPACFDNIAVEPEHNISGDGSEMHYHWLHRIPDDEYGCYDNDPTFEVRIYPRQYGITQNDV